MAGITAFLDYDRTDTTTWAQFINGTGSLRIRHGGTLDLDGTGTVNPTVGLGSLVVGSGTLNLSGGETVNVRESPTSATTSSPTAASWPPAAPSPASSTCRPA